MQKVFLFLLTLVPGICIGQASGKDLFDFLHVPASARLAALGGVNVSLTGSDVNFFMANPALPGDTLAGAAAVSYQFYAADIGLAAMVYRHDFRKAGIISFALQHMDYGSIQGYDANGLETNEFSSGETALFIATTHSIRTFTLGASVKAAFSNIAGYRATAVLADLGGTFEHPNKDLTFGLAFKNIGFVVGDFDPASNRAIPFDVQAGATFKPEHMPLRFSATVFNLAQRKPAFGIDDQAGIAGRILSHMNLGTEIFVHRNVNLLAGYNFLLHRTLRLIRGGAGAGISFGFSVTVKTFELVFSRSTYVAGNAGYSFTLSTNVNRILTRRKML